jgi:hypothetical protein
MFLQIFLDSTLGITYWLTAVINRDLFHLHLLHPSIFGSSVCHLVISHPAEEHFGKRGCSYICPSFLSPFLVSPTNFCCLYYLHDVKIKNIYIDSVPIMVFSDWGSELKITRK